MFPTYLIYEQADKGEDNTIFPCNVPNLGLYPIGDDTTFILLSLNVYTKSDGLRNIKVCDLQN